MTLKNASICTACGKHRTQHPSNLCAACRRQEAKPTCSAQSKQAR